MSSTVIVFEGPEGAGKTTQLQRLARWFDARGEPAVTLREPGGTPIGDEIRRLVLDPARTMTMRTEALLFMASRAELIDSVVRPALERGSTVLLDRFLLSTYAYQGAGRGIGEEELRAANRVATRDLAPTLTLLLRLPAGEGLARVALRGAPDRMERSDAAFHDRVAHAFEVFGTREWQQSHPECGPIVSVDARGSEAAVHARIVAALIGAMPLPANV